MTYREAYLSAVARLTSAPVPTESAELDARVLLGHAAGLSHASLLARWGEPLAEVVVVAFDEAVRRRGEGEPVAWITGTKEFLGLDFLVPVGLLVPRADTETLVEAGLEVTRTRGPGLRVVDVCTGTGCVAVGFAALVVRPAEVWATDLSPLAVATATQNSARLLPDDRRVNVVEANLLQGVDGAFDLILSNPPYLTPAEARERVAAGWREPTLALDGGEEGLELIRALILQASLLLKSGGWLLIEAADAQMDEITSLYHRAGLVEVRLWTDLAGHRRVAGARAR